jgi:hypothetical protein
VVTTPEDRGGMPADFEASLPGLACSIAHMNAIDAFATR